MFQGKEEVIKLAYLFKKRGVSLFHACQFLDFQSYLKLDGIPSRACLEINRLPFTSFETDRQDRSNGVWDKAFINLSDFGSTFARGGRSVPNPYGPILLQLSPIALKEAEDVAICLRSAGGRTFNREQEALKSVEAIDNLFEYPIEVGYPSSAYIKFRKKLREEFQDPQAADPEISCTVTSGRIPLCHVVAVLVDPYIISGKSLFEWVSNLTDYHDMHLPIQERTSTRRGLYKELAHLLAKELLSCWDLSQSSYVSEELRQWAQEIENQHLQYQFRRFANYLRQGTLLQFL